MRFYDVACYWGGGGFATGIDSKGVILIRLRGTHFIPNTITARQIARIQGIDAAISWANKQEQAGLPAPTWG